MGLNIFQANRALETVQPPCWLQIRVENGMKPALPVLTNEPVVGHVYVKRPLVVDIAMEVKLHIPVH